MCNPIFCLIPPHMMCSIVEKGNHDHRAFALQSLVNTERLRGHRHFARNVKLGMPKMSGLHRIIQTANQTQNLIGKTVRTEGEGLTGDQATDEAYAYLGATYDLYKKAFKRNSIDNKGMPLYATVHFGKKFDNAFWNGERMVFGDGDGKIFKVFTRCPEVIGHELTHGVTEFSSKLLYQDQAGALNEGISDVFGSLVKQKLLNQTAEEANWIIGDGLFTNEVQGVGVRNIKHPGQAYDDNVLGKDPCPSNMSDYVNTDQDNGGIHINCTIPSHAFYISAIERGGYAWEHVGKVWYNTITKRLKRNTNFEQFAELTTKVAARLFGQGSLELKAVRKGWKQVGIF